MLAPHVTSAEPLQGWPVETGPKLGAEPEGLLAARLVECALAEGEAGTLCIARSESRAARLYRAARALNRAGFAGGRGV
jgi:hypothetical protein